MIPAGDTRRAWLLKAESAIFVGLGALLFGLTAPRFEGEIPLFLLLLAMNLAAERTPISIYGDSVITVGFVFTLAIIGLFGAPGAAILACLEPVIRRLGRQKLDITLIRSAARAVVVYVLAAEVYAALAPVNPDSVELSMIPAGMAATAVAFVMSALIVVFNAAVRTGQSCSEVWANHRWVAVHYLAFGVVGLSLMASYVGLGYWGIIAFITPVLLLRLSTKQYVDKTAENVEKLKERNAALEKANVEIRAVSDELRVTYNATLETLVAALEARDQETKGHSVRVARYMLTIAEALGVKPGSPEWLDMHHGALLHDVGKIGVPDNILLKPSALTPEEWAQMRKHPEIGYGILREVRFLRGAAEIVLAHHERWDGNGYPKGLRADAIPLGARIFAVVDTFDCMTSDRVYRKALSPRESLEEILRCSGTQFDPRVVEAFLDIYEDWVLEHDRLHDITIVRRAA